MGTEGDDDVSALKAGAGSGLAVGGSIDAHALAVVKVVGHDSERHLKARSVASTALGFGERNLGLAVEVELEPAAVETYIASVADAVYVAPAAAPAPTLLSASASASALASDTVRLR